MDCDVVIVGCGVAGLYAALNLPATSRVVMLSKGELDECDSMLAQGGICVLPEGDDYDSFFEDTMRAGHYENRRESVDIMIRSSRSVINDLVALGVEFNREADGSLAFTREGAHARPRIAFYRDVTGKAITSKLLERVQQLPNVEILDHTAMIDLLVEEGECRGVVACPVTEEQSVRTIDELMPEDVTAPAAGSPAAGDPAAGALPAPAFEIHAGATELTGDAVYLATKYGLETEHLDYVQIHPTGLYSQRPGRTFLISESCRGEGAVLLNQAGERFVDELQPRDVVAAAIREQMRADGSEHEWLSFAPVDPAVVREHFVNIRQRCLEEGRDILDESIPVVPTQHYFMGGVRVDRDSATSMPRLYAAGETSCNGVHGRNRLASNSLLEALVFARRAAYNIATGRSLEVEAAGEPALDGAHRATGFDASIDRLCATPAISVPSASEPVSPARGESSSK